MATLKKAKDDMAKKANSLVLAQVMEQLKGVEIEGHFVVKMVQAGGNTKVF